MPKFLALLLSSALIISFLVGFCFPSQHKDIRFFEALLFIENSELPDFASYQDVNLKKSDFFSFLLPKVQLANERIGAERHFVKSIENSAPQELSKLQKLRIEKLATKYKVKTTEIAEIIPELLVRINMVPASLVLAQAANESAWGTSRFAKKGNNLFGQWCYVKGCGLVPKSRGNNENHEVAKFKNVQASIESYMRNLNSQFSYADLRALRLQQEQQGSLNGHDLAQGLLMYSTRREAYVHEIQLMIRQNDLQQYDKI
jgi:Bax protein